MCCLHPKEMKIFTSENTNAFGLSITSFSNPSGMILLCVQIFSELGILI